MKRIIVFVKNWFAKRSATKDARTAKKANGYPETTPKTPNVPAYKPQAATCRNLLSEIEAHLLSRYELRYNKLTETAEFRQKGRADSPFTAVGQRELNGICLELHRQGIECWDRDVSRYILSTDIPAYHPIREYMEGLPGWDGICRVDALAGRISGKPVWVRGFHRWMLALAAQWSGIDTLHANSVAPVLVSTTQGMHKSTFCKMLVPSQLQAYYTDSFDLASVSGAEQKLAVFGLINLDELDKFSAKKMALLKNLMQMAGLNIRKAYRKNYSPLPRVASFIATSNQKDLLTDPTGSRRFLCAEITRKIDCSPIDHLQLFAQLKAELANGMRYWFTTGEEAAIMENNAPFRKRGMEEDIFYRCYRLPQKDEKGEYVSAADIYGKMKKKHPSAMRDISAIVLGRLLTSIGIPRIHTKMGNRYHVCALPE